MFDLTAADMDGADLSDARLEIVMFDEAKLRGAHLRSAYGKWPCLVSADLRKADLSEVRLSFPKFVMADLSEANLKNASGSALRFQRTRTATFPCADVGAGPVPQVAAAVVERLSSNSHSSMKPVYISETFCADFVGFKVLNLFDVPFFAN